jgi:DNA primase
MSEALFDLIRDGAGDKTPEQRAQLRHHLEAAAQRITDRALSREYRGVLLDRFFANRRPRGSTPPGPRPLPRPQPGGAASIDERARILTAILLRYPAVLHNVGDAFEKLDLPLACDRLRKALLSWADRTDVLDSSGLIDHLTASGLAADGERVLAAVPPSLTGIAAAEATLEDVEAAWWHYYRFMQRGRLEQDILTAQRECEARMDQDSQRRLIALRREFVSIQCGEEQREAGA